MKAKALKREAREEAAREKAAREKAAREEAEREEQRLLEREKEYQAAVKTAAMAREVLARLSRPQEAGREDAKLGAEKARREKEAEKGGAKKVPDGTKVNGPAETGKDKTLILVCLLTTYEGPSGVKRKFADIAADEGEEGAVVYLQELKGKSKNRDWARKHPFQEERRPKAKPKTQEGVVTLSRPPGYVGMSSTSRLHKETTSKPAEDVFGTVTKNRVGMEKSTGASGSGNVGKGKVGGGGTGSGNKGKPGTGDQVAKAVVVIDLDDKSDDGEGRKAKKAKKRKVEKSGGSDSSIEFVP